MPADTITRRLFWVAEALLLAGTIACAILLGQPDEWQPVTLVALLLALAVLGDWLSIETPSGRLSCAFIAIVLAMALLGPVPAVVFSLAAAVPASAKRRLEPFEWLNLLSTFAVVPFVGGLMVLALAGDVHHFGTQHLSDSALFGLIILSVFAVVTGLNFLLFALHKVLDRGRSFMREVHELFLPLLPGQLAAGMLATILAVAYTSVGMPMLIGSVAVLLILRHLTVALLRSEERAEQLEARSLQLSGLQWGVLRTLGRVLGMRDKSSGRHAAATARYAEALALELQCSEQERDLVHAAGLLHEIGKFSWPDSILQAEVVTDKDMALVKNHPQEGALLVGALDGYGDVADAILYHHERVDGRGYPAGLIGREIPLASRIVAICSTYDTLTAGQSYRPVLAPQEAIDELRHAATNGQLDSDLVESFVAVLEREGSTFAKDADFEAELEFERRIRKMAAPRSGAEALAKASEPAGGARARAISRA